MEAVEPPRFLGGDGIGALRAANGVVQMPGWGLLKDTMGLANDLHWGGHIDEVDLGVVVAVSKTGMGAVEEVLLGEVGHWTASRASVFPSHMARGLGGEITMDLAGDRHRRQGALVDRILIGELWAMNGFGILNKLLSCPTMTPTAFWTTVPTNMLSITLFKTPVYPAIDC